MQVNMFEITCFCLHSKWLGSGAKPRCWCTGTRVHTIFSTVSSRIHQYLKYIAQLCTRIVWAPASPLTRLICRLRIFFLKKGLRILFFVWKKRLRILRSSLWRMKRATATAPVCYRPEVWKEKLLQKLMGTHTASTVCHRASVWPYWHSTEKKKKKKSTECQTHATWHMPGAAAFTH